MPSVDFWYEFASVYSYPAAMRVEALAAARGVTLNWRRSVIAGQTHGYPAGAGPRRRDAVKRPRGRFYASLRPSRRVSVARRRARGFDVRLRDEVGVIVAEMAA